MHSEQILEVSQSKQKYREGSLCKSHKFFSHFDDFILLFREFEVDYTFFSGITYFLAMESRYYMVYESNDVSERHISQINKLGYWLMR